MQKLGYRKFGGVEVLELLKTDIPTPKPHTVLVKVKAAAINPVDWKMRNGELKILSGFRLPQGSGLEFSGIIEAVGSGVTQFKVGEEVFGAGKDCMAEYAVVNVKKICHKPASISHEQATTIPIVGITAQSIFTKLLTIKKGMEVLVNGATGGIGMFATQMAQSRGAIVTAVVSAKGIETVKKWGVEHIINYRDTNILESNKKYDVVVELSDKLSFSEGKKLLKERGIYVASLPNPKEILGGLINNIFSKRKYKLVGAFANQSNLKVLINEIQQNNLDIIVGKSYALNDFKEAYTETKQGKFLGKVVFSV